MNERIKELAEQADIKLDYFGYGVDIDGGNPNVSKFAELIIHECAIAMSKIPGGYSAEKYYESNKIIKQHFGVE